MVTVSARSKKALPAVGLVLGIRRLVLAPARGHVPPGIL